MLLSNSFKLFYHLQIYFFPSFVEVRHVTIRKYHVISACENMAIRPVHLLQAHLSTFWLLSSVLLNDAFNSMLYVVNI